MIVVLCSWWLRVLLVDLFVIVVGRGSFCLLPSSPRGFIGPMNFLQLLINRPDGGSAKFD